MMSAGLRISVAPLLVATLWPAGAGGASLGAPDEVVEHLGARLWFVELEGVGAVLAEEGASRPSLTEVKDLPRAGSAPFVVAHLDGAERVSLARSGDVRGVFPVYRCVQTGGAVVALDEIAARVGDEIDLPALARWARAHGMTVTGGAPSQPEIVHLRLDNPSSGTAFEAAEALRASGLVTWAEPVLWAEAWRHGGETPPALQWHLDNTGIGGGSPDADIDAPEAWDITTGDPSLVYAILDDGVDLSHPDLTTWLNFDEGFLVDGIDSDGNGFVDDIVGWDFADGDSDPNPTAFIPPFNFVSHNDIHGTPVAGLTAAFGLVAPGAPLRSSGVVQGGRIMALRVIAAGQFVSSSAHAAAIRYAVDNGADVINMSYSVAVPSREVEDAMEYALTNGRGGRGTPIFAAAGDLLGAPVAWPAASPWTAAVSGVTNLNGATPDASFGEQVTFSAPTDGGTLGIFTTDVTVEDRGFDDFGSDYTRLFGGSSASTAIASGVAGLVMSVSPEIAWHELWEVMQRGTDKDPPGGPEIDPFGWSPFFGWGRLNAHATLVAISTEAASTSPEVFFDDQYEENDSFAAAAQVPVPFFQHLILAGGEEDNFRFTVQPDDFISAKLWCLSSGNPPSVELLGTNGFAFASGEANADGSLGIEFPNTSIPQDFIIRVSSDLATGETMGYTLFLRSRAFDEYESNDVPADAAALASNVSDEPTLIAARFDPPGDVDHYAISGSAGDQVVIETLARNLDPPLPPDTFLGLYRQDLVTPLALNDDYENYDSRIEVTLPADELYILVVYDVHGGGGTGWIYGLQYEGFTESVPATPQIVGEVLGVLPEHSGTDLNRDGRTDAADVLRSVAPEPGP